jgi:ribonucleotide monophosphatase NagD (HAD superfamily)
METDLVLSGVTSKEDLVKYAYRPTHVIDGVGDIIKGIA